MGQKIHPNGFRVGVIRTWQSRWFSKKDYATWLHEDAMIRSVVNSELRDAGIAKIEIERAANKCKINIFTSRPGIVIGKKGAGLDVLKKKLAKGSKSELFINIHEVRKADADAQLVALNVAQQLERRISFRRAMKKALQNSMKLGAKGVRISVAGRLGGADMSRRESYIEGSVPLHTLRADIEYGFAEAKTTYGQIGVKCWIFKGEVLPEGKMKSA